MFLRTCIALVVLAAPSGAAPRPVAVTVESHDGLYRVVGGFGVDDPSVAWRVLTDYERIPTFVSSMRSSQVETRTDSTLMLRQRAKAGLMLFKRTMEVLLEVREVPQRSIRFHDVSGQDFDVYAGEWIVESDSLGAAVRYELETRPRGVPRLLGSSAVRRNVQRLLEDVRKEIIRRGGLRGATQDLVTDLASHADTTGERP